MKHILWKQRKTIQLNWLSIFCTWNVDDISSWQAEAVWLINSSPTSFIYNTNTHTVHEHQRTMNAFIHKRTWQNPITAKISDSKIFPLNLEENITFEWIFWYSFDWNTLFHLLTFSLYVPLDLKWIYTRQDICESYFFNSFSYSFFCLWSLVYLHSK